LLLSCVVAKVVKYDENWWTLYMFDRSFGGLVAILLKVQWYGCGPKPPYITIFFFGWTEGHQGFDTHMFSEDFGSQQLPNFSSLASIWNFAETCNVDELSPQTRVMQKWSWLGCALCFGPSLM
jgi:hypothetical protein